MQNTNLASFLLKIISVFSLLLQRTENAILKHCPAIQQRIYSDKSHLSKEHSTQEVCIPFHSTMLLFYNSHSTNRF